jgi:hypothetical protein
MYYNIKTFKNFTVRRPCWLNGDGCYLSCLLLPFLVVCRLSGDDTRTASISSRLLKSKLPNQLGDGHRTDRYQHGAAHCTNTVTEGNICRRRFVNIKSTATPTTAEEKEENMSSFSSAVFVFFIF